MQKSPHDNLNWVRNRTKKSFTQYYSIRPQERRDLIQEINVSALVLFEYYIRMASVGDQHLSDEKAADYFGWSIKTATKWRRALINKGWIFVERAAFPGGRSSYIYHLGKEEVVQAKSHYPPKPSTLIVHYSDRPAGAEPRAEEGAVEI